MVEDAEDDALLIEHALREAGYKLQTARVETDAALIEALAQQPWDVVLADFSLPRFDALSALATVHASDQPQLPFIIVSGGIGEDIAVAAMRAGVHDYVLKDKLERLAPAIERELRAAVDRAQTAELERRLVHTERLAAIGQLAAGVAHEINNPLTYIFGNMEVIEDHIEQLQKLHTLAAAAAESETPAGQALRDFMRSEDIDYVLRDIDDIRVASLSGVERIAAIVRDLRTFSRIDQHDIELVDINDVAETACHMVENTVRHRATLERRFGDVRRFPGDLGKLTQVLVNVLVNSAQAIGGDRADENRIVVSTSEVDGDAVVTVTDTGRGIPEHLLEQIFEPFFTTKSRDEGTGLGLALCADIIRKHGGEITVTSKLDIGTRVMIHIPLDNGLQPTRPERLATPTSSVDPSALRVLLIDDEPEILRAYQRILSHGPTLTLAQSGEEALDLIERDTGYDVIVCDVMMPGMNGTDFHRALESRWPALAERTLFITGGALSESARDLLLAMDNRVLRKPISPQRLVEAIVTTAAS